ncbi:MAG: hypothetical protein WA220_05220 [Candidatus Nitrosopolaris sp.]
MGQLVDKLVGKTMAIGFDNLPIDMPKAQGPCGRHIEVSGLLTAR